jgi:hypothetical protein
MSTVLDQLPRGAIRLAFGELRQRSTPGFFSHAHDADNALVDLPLAEVLARLPASHLRRRPEQKSQPLPQSIPAVFGTRGQGMPATSLITVAPTPASTPVLTDQLSTTRGLAAHGPAVSAQAQYTAPPQYTAPAQHTIPAPTLDPARSFAHVAAPRVNSTPVALASPSAPAPAAGSNEPMEPIKAPLAPLARNWPEQLRREIMTTYLAASVNIPFPELEGVMKRGKAVFSWKQIRLWMTPKGSDALSEHDSVGLELPLAILTPLFMARRSGDRSSKKAALTPEMPDVFVARKPQEATHELTVAPTAIAAPAASLMAPAGQPVPVPTPEAPVKVDDRARGTPAAGNQLDRLTIARSSPLPTQLVQRACHLSGVSGALLATADGLVIASQVAPGMCAESIAAFLPEIYSRLNQYTRELKLGDPTHIEMLAGNIPLQIFKTANTYYAVFGKPAEPLPKLQLTALAAQLSQPQH